MVCTSQPNLLTPTHRDCNLDCDNNLLCFLKQRCIYMCLSHVHASECNFWITYFPFPLNFIFSVLVRLQADLVSPVPVVPLAIVLAPEGSRAVVDWQHHWIPLHFLYSPDRARSLLRRSYHACHAARREGKEGKAGGVLSARRGFFLFTLLLDKKPISNPSRWLKRLRCSFRMCIIGGGGGS